jgi:hypothetical protein
MRFQFGSREFEAEGPALTLQLRSSRDLLEDPVALRARMDQDGFLYIPGFHDRFEVLATRLSILDRLQERPGPDPAGFNSSVRGKEDLRTPELKQLLYGPRVMGFFERFLGGPVMSFNFQWLRAVGKGAGSGIHMDAVYMGRGTSELYTCWTPLGDIPPEMGPLVVCPGSNRWERVRDTYGRSDVDRDRIAGVFTHDPQEIVDRFGGRWATTSFRAGDAVILSLYTLHASLTNMTHQLRISCDTGYQRGDAPVDDRWAGEAPCGHVAYWSPEVELEPVEVSRRRWGV